jgi:hypothetical protein
MIDIDVIEPVTTMEAVIRDLAASVASAVANRRDHPSFGYSKASINRLLERMEGAIGMYMVLTGQASHAGVPSLARFNEGETKDRVAKARALVRNL